MSNLTIPRELWGKFQDQLEKDYSAYLQQRKYLKNQNITMSSLYGNADNLHRRKQQNKQKNLVTQHVLVQTTLQQINGN